MLDELLNAIQTSHGFIKPNLFRIELQLPEALSHLQERVLRTSIMCTAGEIPGYSIQTKKASTGRHTPEIASDVVFSDVDLRFYLSGDLFERDMLESWRDLMINLETGTTGYYNDYIGTVKVIPLRRTRNGFKEADRCSILHEAYPGTVGAIQFDYENQNQVARVNATFKYRIPEFTTYDA